jgi:diadenosine tetraphosphate (Ap4A) HIT family hydrolase
MTDTCGLCAPENERVLWSDTRCRVILVDQPDYPGFCRVIWRAHVTEMTELEPADRSRLMEVVFALESALRATVAPDKVNVASLGNQTPHLHWHVVPRWSDDPNFPATVWSPPLRTGAERSPLDVDALDAALAEALG